MKNLIFSTEIDGFGTPPQRTTTAPNSLKKPQNASKSSPKGSLVFACSRNEKMLFVSTGIDGSPPFYPKHHHSPSLKKPKKAVKSRVFGGLAGTPPGDICFGRDPGRPGTPPGQPVPGEPGTTRSRHPKDNLSRAPGQPVRDIPRTTCPGAAPTQPVPGGPRTTCPGGAPGQSPKTTCPGGLRDNPSRGAPGQPILD